MAKAVQRLTRGGGNSKELSISHGPTSPGIDCRVRADDPGPHQNGQERLPLSLLPQLRQEGSHQAAVSVRAGVVPGLVAELPAGPGDVF